MSISIRKATPADLDWIVTQLKEFSQFVGTKRPLFEDVDYARGGILFLIAEHLVLVADKEGSGPVGFIAGMVTPHTFNQNIRVLAEMFWWVAEEHRGSRAGLMLLNAFTAWGKENADWVACALPENGFVKDSCLKKRGFRLQERNFLLEVS